MCLEILCGNVSSGGIPVIQENLGVLRAVFGCWQEHLNTEAEVESLNQREILIISLWILQVHVFNWRFLDSGTVSPIWLLHRSCRHLTFSLAGSLVPRGVITRHLNGQESILRIVNNRTGRNIIDC